jgi:hypothetical protein
MSGASPLDPRATTPPTPARAHFSTFAPIARTSMSSLSNGVTIGGKTAAKFTAGERTTDQRPASTDKKSREQSFCSRLGNTPCVLVDLTAPDRFGTLPVVVEDRPERLVEIFAVSQEGFAEHAFLSRADLA